MKNVKKKIMYESLCKALLDLYDDLYSFSQQDFYNFILNNI